MKIKHLLVSTFLLMAGMSQGQYIYTFNNGNANNESTVSSTSGFNGTLAGTGAALMADRFGNANQAYNLNGTGKINLGNNPFMTGKGSFTLTMWAQKPASNHIKGFFTKGAGNTKIRTYNNGYLYAYVPEFTGFVSANAYLNIAEGSWFHLAYVKSGTTLNLYVNGILYGQNTSVATLSNATADNLLIGYSGDAGSETSILNGGVDDIFIFDYALSAAQVIDNKDFNTVKIVTQPIQPSACTIPASLSVSASGTNLTYLWSNGETTTGISATASGNYNVTVSSSFGRIVSNTVQVGTNIIPVIVTQPESKIFCSGSALSTTFSVSALGLNLSYLWNTGETTRTITNAVEGSYKVTVTGLCNSVISNLAMLSTITCNEFIYSFNKGNANNDNPNYANGTLTGSGAIFAADRFGNAGMALNFGNTGVPSLNLGDNPFMKSTFTFSMALWVESADNQNRGLFSKGSLSAYQDNFSYQRKFGTFNNGNFNSLPSAPVLANAPYAAAAANWYHVAYVMDNGNVKVYINGFEYGSYVSSAISNAATNLIFSFAYGSGGTQFYKWNTRIDDIYIYNYALTPSQVMANKNLPNPNAPVIVKQPEANNICFNGTPQNLDVVAAGTNLTYLWNTGATTTGISASTAGMYVVTVTNSFGSTVSQKVIIDAAPTIATQPFIQTCVSQTAVLSVTSFGNASYLWNNGATTPTISPIDGGNYNVTVTNACGFIISNSVSLTGIGYPSVANKVLHLNFNGDYTDLSSTNAVGTSTGTLGLDRCGNPKSALQLENGQNLKLNLSSYPALKVGASPSGSFTISLWAQHTNIGNADLYATMVEYNLGKLYFRKAPSGTTSANYGFGAYDQSAGFFSFSNWNNYTLTKDNTTGITRFYLNGVLVQSMNTPAFVNYVATNDLLIIGGGRATCNWEGLIDDVIIYDRNLTAAEVKVLYSGAAPTTIVSAVGNATCINALANGISVSATGSNLTYKWSNGETVSGFVPATAGLYNVTVFGTNGNSSTSIDVLPNTANITVQPFNSTVCSGVLATIQLSAGAVSYIWNNGNTVSGFQTSVAGIYTCTITGSCGLTNVSNPVTVTVNELTSFVTRPETQTICGTNATATLNSSAVGTNIRYIWSGNLGTTAGINVSTSGTFMVTATGACGRLTASATITNCNSIIDNLVLSLPFNGNANDVSPTNAIGINRGSFGIDRFGNANSALSLFGQSLTYNLATYPALKAGSSSGQFTFSCWAKAVGTTMTQYASIFETNSGDMFMRRQSNTNNLETYIKLSNGISYNVSRAVTFTNWNMYTVTYNKSTSSLQLFVNGVYVSSASGANFNLDYSVPNKLVIGGDRPLTQWNGLIDDVFIYDKALTPTEITQLYAINPSVKIVTKPQSACSVPANLSVSASGINLTYLWSNGATTSTTTATTFGNYTVTVTSTFGNAISNTSVLSNVNCNQFIYNFNNGNANEVENVFNGTVSGGAALMADRFGIANKAYNLNGTGSINLGDNPFMKGSTQFSLTMWVQKPLNTVITGFFKKGTTYMASYDAGDVYAYNYATNNAGYTQIPSIPNSYSQVNNNTWLHLAYVLNAGTLSIFVDGAFYGSVSGVGALGNTTDNLIIGFSDSQRSIPSGGVDDIYIYNYALTAAQVLDNKNNIISSTPAPSTLETSTALIIYPNPSTGAFTVENGESITVYDLLGKVILSTSESTFTILNKGVFVAKVKTANGVKFVKLVVE